jgi:hypothetical protein
LEEMWGQRRDQGPAVIPSPFLVQTLTDMGFARDRVEQVNYKMLKEQNMIQQRVESRSDKEEQAAVLRIRSAFGPDPNLFAANFC